MSLAKKLHYARDYARLTLAQVREKTGIGESSLSEFENGKREPSLSQLTLLAQTYGRPESFFLTDDPIPQEVILWREKPKNARETELTFLRLCQQYHQLEGWAGETRSVKLPKRDIALGEWTVFAADALADQVHQNLALGDCPASCLLSVLEERCGIKVFYLDFEPSGTAAAIRSEHFGAAILLNRKNIRWRRHFDLAHELFHLLTWNEFPHADDSEPTSVKAGDQEEYLANRFAAGLLIPAEALKRALASKAKNELTYVVLYDIARQFDVSVDALVWRLFDLKWLHAQDRNKIKDLIGKIKQIGGVFEPRQDTEPPPWPDRYRSLAIRVYRQGGMSTGKFADFLNLSRLDAMKYIEPEVLDNEKVPVTDA